MRGSPPIVAAALFLLLSPAALSHPTFSNRSVVNAAGFLPPELDGGAVARGSIFTVFGSQLGPTAGVQATSFPLSTDLAGVTLEISQPGMAPLNAIPLFAVDGQINAIMPSNAPLGDAVLRVNFTDADGGTSSPPIAIRIVESSFGIFTINASGQGPAVATNFVPDAADTINSTLESAQPGQFVTLWGTGLGAIAAADNQRPIDVDAVQDLQAAAQAAVFFGGVEATNIFYAGRSAEFAGLDQVIVQVPENAPLGCYTPVMVRARGLVSNIATIALSSEGGVCRDAMNPYLAPEIGDNFGAAVLTRLTRFFANGDSTTDTGTGSFQRLVNRDWFFNPIVSLPPLGSCLVYVERDGFGGLPSFRPAAPLEAGSLTVAGPAGQRFFTRTEAGFHEALFGTSRQPPLFLSPGDYELRGPGGSGVGAFTAQSAQNAPLDWVLAGASAVDRSAGLTVTWTPGDPTNSYVRLFGVSSNSATESNNVTGTFLCTAAADAGAFTVLPEVLANVPPSQGSGVTSTAFLYVGLATLPEAGRFEAGGLDYGLFELIHLTGRPIELR